MEWWQLLGLKEFIMGKIKLSDEMEAKYGYMKLRGENFYSRYGKGKSSTSDNKKQQ